MNKNLENLSLDELAVRYCKLACAYGKYPLMPIPADNKEEFEKQQQEIWDELVEIRKSLGMKPI